LAAGAHLILKVGWLWTLLVAPLAILVLGLTAQAAGILSREEPK
jgi:ATP/ADP translocase